MRRSTIALSALTFALPMLAVVAGAPCRAAAWDARGAGMAGDRHDGAPALRLGMTPDEVASTPGWGPASSRLRTQSGDVLTEVWTYQDARLLVFENGELVYVRDRRR